MNTDNVVVSDADLLKIREMYLSGEDEDKRIAENWLKQLIGERDAEANLFILLFYKDWDDDSDEKLNDGTWYKIKFSTYQSGFGKNYKYEVVMLAHFQGQEIVNTSNDYSRWKVGNGEPKWEFCQLVCDKLRTTGVTFYQPLFTNKTLNNG